jgi:ferredoxin
VTYVVTERCVNSRYTDCVVVCPVDCFYEITEPHRMLVIHPDECTDCNACVSQCPVNAIWPDHELPAVFEPWKAFNAEHAPRGANRKEGSDPLPTARLLEEIQAEERAKGLEVAEPTSASS